MSETSLTEVARSIGVSADTLRRWKREGIVPVRNGEWTPAAVAQARIVARLRQRRHSLEEVRRAARSGQLAYGYMEELFPPAAEHLSLEDAARETGLEAALIERIWTAAGFSTAALEDGISNDDVQLLGYMGAVLQAGFPLVAFLQLVRVYSQALAAIADAEVKLFHLFVHEPLIREGVGGTEIAEEMAVLASELLPLASPIMDHVHLRFLQHFIEQDVVGHLELEVDGETELNTTDSGPCWRANDCKRSATMASASSHVMRRQPGSDDPLGFVRIIGCCRRLGCAEIAWASLPLTQSTFPVGCDGSRFNVNVPSPTVARAPQRETHNGQ